MKTLVIGGTGQVGSHVVKGLVGKGASVRVLSRSKDKASSLPAGVELVTGDLNDPMNARAAFQGVEAVFMANPVAQTEANEGICGVALARETWTEFTAEQGAAFDRLVCHQVGSIHRRKLYETLGLDLARDFSTFETLGNTGSVALPATLATAVQAGAVRDGDRVGLLGIGSGLNCLMLALEW